MDDGADRVALVCVRDSRRYGLQVLLRSEVALAGAEGHLGWLPEGDVEADDYAPRVLERCHGLTGTQARGFLGHGMRPARAMGHWVAGMRVLLDVSGVLFVVRGTSREAVRRTLPLRGDPPSGRRARELAAYLKAQDLYVDLTRLLFFSTWTGTRPGTIKAFFLVRVSENIRADGFVWRRPERALLFWRKQGGSSLDFPAFATLRLLSDFSSFDSLFAEYAAR